MSVPNCASLTGDYVPVCAFIESLATAAVVPSCANNEYLGNPFGNGTLRCMQYASPVQKSAGMLGNQGYIDTGNTAWMLVSAAFVMIQSPAVGFFYAGLAGESSASNTILMSFAALSIVTVQWYLFGYSWAFGPGTNGWGSFQWGCLTGVSYQPSAVYGWAIPHIAYVAFQGMFAAITPALISGGVIGRFKFTSFCVFVFVWTSLVYDPIAHWVWSGTLDENYQYTCLGFLCSLGALDFAGGTVIHITSGFAALAASIQLGKRYNFDQKVVPHNTPLIVIGASLIWMGWFGFNAGSATGAASPVPGPTVSLASVAFWNSHIAASSAAISWMFWEKVIHKTTGPAGAAAGCVAGLVAITPACGYVESWAAIVIGLVVSPVCLFSVWVKGKMGMDDTLDAWAVHGMGGVAGAFMTGLFATSTVNPYIVGLDGAFYGRGGAQLGPQVAAIVVSATYTFCMTYFILEVMKRSPLGIRISEEDEKMGIDVSEHGQKAYHNGA